MAESSRCNLRSAGPVQVCPASPCHRARRAALPGQPALSKGGPQAGAQVQALLLPRQGAPAGPLRGRLWPPPSCGGCRHNGGAGAQLPLPANSGSAGLAVQRLKTEEQHQQMHMLHTCSRCMPRKVHEPSAPTCVNRRRPAAAAPAAADNPTVACSAAKRLPGPGPAANSCPLAAACRNRPCIVAPWLAVLCNARASFQKPSLSSSNLKSATSTCRGSCHERTPGASTRLSRRHPLTH